MRTGSKSKEARVVIKRSDFSEFTDTIIRRNYYNKMDGRRGRAISKINVQQFITIIYEKRKHGVFQLLAENILARENGSVAGILGFI